MAVSGLLMFVYMADGARMSLINIKSMDCPRADPSLVSCRNRPSFDFFCAASTPAQGCLRRPQPMPLHLPASSSTIQPYDLLLQWHSWGQGTLTWVLGAH